MYVLRMEGLVAEGQAQRFEQTMTDLGERLKKHQGFDRGALLNSISNPTSYTRMLRFINRESAHNWLAGHQLASIANDSGLGAVYTPARPTEAYELVEVVRGDGLAVGRFVHIADWAIASDAANTAKYEADRKELFELRRRTGTGFVAMLLLRSLAAAGRYVMYSVSSDEEAHRMTAAVPETRKWVQDHPAAGYGCPGPVQQTFDLLQAYVPE
jgi:heme-degrading monooxygenase HmoA